MSRKLWQGLLEDGLKVSIAQLCAWFGVPRRTVYYQPTKSTPRVNLELAAPIRKMIDERGGSENGPGDRFPARPLLWLSDRGLASWHEQEHRRAPSAIILEPMADYGFDPAKGLAGQEKTGRNAAPDPGSAVSRQGAE